MKTKILNEFNMFFALKGHMEKNLHIWNSVIEIENAVIKFINNVDKLSELKISTGINLEAIFDKKEQYKKALVNEGNPVINVLMVYSKEIGNKSLTKKLNFCKKKIEDYKDFKLLDYYKAICKESKKLYTKALTGRENADLKVQENKSILNYGLSGKMIDNLEEETQNFEHSYLAYTEAKSQKIKDLIKFKLLCKKNKDILKNKIDLLISIFEKTEPEFYTQYKVLRNVEKKEKTKGKNKKVKKTQITVKKTEVVEKKTVNSPLKSTTNESGNSNIKTATVKKSPVKPAIKSRPSRSSRPKRTTKPVKTPVASKNTKLPSKPAVKKADEKVSGTEKTEK